MVLVKLSVSLLLLLFLPTRHLGAYAQRVQIVPGEIVAYQFEMSCINGNEYSAALIRITQDKARTPVFAKLPFSQPCGRVGGWIAKHSRPQMFHLKRDVACDITLTVFLDIIEGDVKRPSSIPVWKLVRGHEHETLPYGSTVACYSSPGVPYAPIF